MHEKKGLGTIGGSYRSEGAHGGLCSITLRIAHQTGGQPRQMGGCSCILPPAISLFLGRCARRGFACSCTQRFALTLPRIAS